MIEGGFYMVLLACIQGTTGKEFHMVQAAWNVKASKRGFHKLQATCNVKKARGGNRKRKAFYIAKKEQKDLERYKSNAYDRPVEFIYTPKSTFQCFWCFVYYNKFFCECTYLHFSLTTIYCLSSGKQVSLFIRSNKECIIKV